MLKKLDVHVLVDTTENKRLKNKTKREKQEYLKNLHACVYIGKAIECFCFFLFCALMVFFNCIAIRRDCISSHVW